VPIGPQADSSWLLVVPWGIQRVLRHVAQTYGNPPVYITENGVDVPGEDDMPLALALNDTFRVDFVRDYISYVEKGQVRRPRVLRCVFSADRANIHRLTNLARGPWRCDRYTKESAKWYASFIAKH
jgi:hypothetical protein